MKKLVLFSAAILFSVLTFGFSLTSCNDHDQVIIQENLPNTSKTFLKTHFPDCQVLYVKMERDDFFGKEYDVKMNCGVEIDFNKQGEWTDVDCNMSQVPDAIVPAAILSYVKTNYPDAFITQISKERKGYDVELNNDLDLEFDKKGNFLRIDH